MSASLSLEPPADKLSRLAAVAGAAAVLTGAEAEPFWTDVYRAAPVPPLAVVRPDTVEVLAAVVAEAAALGLAIYPRGGGASYTDGYLPTREGAVIIDCGRLDRIVEINREDAYVTVEAGVTWAQLKAALDPLGLRTPFFGPFSGLAATVGGSISQTSLSHGSGAHGVSAQSVLAVEVVTASGAMLATGSAGRGAPPFARYYGPDAAGLFTGDCGALGIKARITLPLIAAKPSWGALSFTFESLPEMAAAMRRAALEQLDDEHFAIDSALAQGQIARNSGAGAALEVVRATWRAAPSKPAALLRLAKLAASGVRALEAAAYTVHYIVEGVSRADVEARLRRLRGLLAPGREIPNTVPTVVRGMPFAPLYNVLGPKGERWVPLHGVLPHSRVAAFHGALEALYARHDEEMRRLGVWRGGMFETVGPGGFLYEVALYWPGPQTAYHLAVIPEDYRAGLPVYQENPEAAALVERLKGEVIALYESFQASHFQLGKLYPYASVLDPELLGLLRAVKQELDPRGLMNPGALGL